MKNILSFILVLIFVFAAVPGVLADEGTIVNGVSLVKIGEFEVPAEPAVDQARTHWEELMYAAGSGIEYLDDGCYSVPGPGEDVNRKGLFTEEGEQLIPFEAALIRRLNSRYLTVYYATEKTENRLEAILYTTDGSSWIAQGHPKEGDTLYKGYIRFYDLELKRFVGDLTASEMYSSSGRLLVLKGKGIEEPGIYDENGVKVSDNKWETGNGFLLKPQKELYDEELNLRYTSDTSLQKFTSGSGYILKSVKDGGYRIIDIDGNAVSEEVYKSVYEEQAGYFSALAMDGSYVLLSAEKGVLATGKERFTCLNDGYWYGKDENGYIFIGPDGIIAENLKNRPESCLQAYEKQSDGKEYTLVLNTGEWALQAGRAISMGPGLLRETTHTKNGDHHILYDVFTGETLLEGDYEKLYFVGRLIWLQNGMTCEVYRVQYQYR